MKACTDKDAHAVALWNRSLGTGGSRVISAKDVRLSNVVDRTGFLDTLNDTLGFTPKVDFNAGVVAAGEAIIESTVTGAPFAAQVAS